ncbi:hypothetical protein D3C84_1297740 [compost metagenome]
MAAQCFGNPVGDVMTRIDAVVEAGMLHAAFAFSEDFKFSFWAVDQLLVSAMRPLQWNL